MLPLDPGKLNIKSEGAVDWEQGLSQACQISVSFYFFFQQAAGERGREDAACSRVSSGERRWKSEIFFLSSSLGRSTINPHGRIKF